MFHEGALPRIKGVGGVDIGFQTMRAEHRLGISLQYKNEFFFLSLVSFHVSYVSSKRLCYSTRLTSL